MSQKKPGAEGTEETQPSERTLGSAKYVNPDARQPSVVRFGAMAKLNSLPLYPVNLTGGGIPVNLVLNKTPQGKFQIARVNKPGGPQEGDFDVLKEFEDEHSAREYARSQVRRDFPGLI